MDKLKDDRVIFWI